MHNLLNLFSNRNIYCEGLLAQKKFTKRKLELWLVRLVSGTQTHFTVHIYSHTDSFRALTSFNTSQLVYLPPFLFQNDSLLMSNVWLLMSDDAEKVIKPTVEKYDCVPSYITEPRLACFNMTSFPLATREFNHTLSLIGPFFNIGRVQPHSLTH